MKTAILCLFLVALVACNKTEKTAPNKQDEPSSQRLDAAAADFKRRVSELEHAKMEGVVFADIKHDILRTNSYTSPLKAEVRVKKTVFVGGHPSVYNFTVHALFTEGEWHYDKCVGTLTTDGEEFKISEDSFKVETAYDLVQLLHLKHDDNRFPQPK